MNSKPEGKREDQLVVRTWSLPYAATLGSSTRSQGIFLQVRAQLPAAVRKSLSVKARELSLRMPAGETAAFEAACNVVWDTPVHIESRPILPREAEDILGITNTERHRWLKDGRLPSAGTRTVKLKGRARSITFHVFDPRLIEDVLDRDLVPQWREDDALKAAENRRRAAWKRKLTRIAKKPTSSAAPENGPQLVGWKEFERNGPLR